MKTRRSTKEIKSEPVDEEQPQAVSSNVIKKEEAREEQKEPEEKCLVCYKQITNPSRLDTCNHPICVECMKLWLEHAMSCCTCRAEPKDHVIVNEGRPNEYTISITEIVRTKERRQRLEAGQSVPLTLERAIIRKAKHEYQAEIERINKSDSVLAAQSEPETITAPIAHRGRGAVRRPQNDQRKRYRELVEAQNVLNVLLDETDRKNIVSNRHFRKLIYQYNCRWYSASEGIGTSYTPNNVRENDEAEAERLRPFIQKELDFVNYVRFGAFRTKRARDDMAKTIFSRLKDMPIHTPTLHTMLVVELGIDMRHAERLQHELFSFAASRLSEEEFYAISCYKLPNVVGQLNDFAVGGLNQMPQQQPPAVVTLDDEPMTIEDDDDVMVVESLSTPRVLSESNYVREEHRESPDRDAALYARPGCLVNFAAPAFFPHSAIQYTNFGFGVPEISTRFSHRPPPQLAAPPQIAQVFTIDDTSEPDTAEAAIVLDDGPSSSGGGAQERPKRPFESQSQQEPILLDDSCCTEPSQDSQQDDDDDGRFSKRKADRHQKGLEKQIRRMRETQDFRSMISWMNEQTRKMETEMRGRGEQPPVFRTRSGSTRRGEERGGARRYPRHGTDHRPSSRRH